MNEFIQSIAHANTDDFLFALGLCAIGTIAGFWGFLRSQRHSHSIANTPTSRIRSAAQGFVELEGWGRLLPGEPVRAPLTHSLCLWWKFSIEEKRHTTRNGRRSSEWVRIDGGTSEAIFELYDETGSCVIDPDGAEVIPSRKQQWYGHRPWPDHGPRHSLWGLFGKYRYCEEVLLPECELYTLGLFRTQRVAHGGHFDENAELTALLNEWKQDQARLLQRFDLNRDGRLDLKEWEAARRVALMQLRRDQMEHDSQPGLHVLAKTTDGRPFILSSQSQPDLLRRKRLHSALFAMLTVASFSASATLMLARGWL